MRNPENVLNSLQEHSAQSGYVYDRLYRNLFNRDFFLQVSPSRQNRQEKG